MCQGGLAVTAILIFVVGPSGRGAFQTYADSWSPPIDLSAPMATIPATGLAGPLLLQLDDPATYSLTNAESTEEQQGYTFNSYYAPSTVNFHDIYSNSLALLAEDPVSTTIKEDESFHINNMPTQFVEFHPKTQTLTPPTTPAPMFLLNSALIKNETTTTTSTTTTTEEPEESSIKVIPIKKNYQRGVLDLLFPSSRVKTFKSVFDTFRRMMSHTFR